MEKDYSEVHQLISPHLEVAQREQQRQHIPFIWTDKASRQIHEALPHLSRHLDHCYSVKEIKYFLQLLCKIDQSNWLAAITSKIQRSHQRPTHNYIFPLFGVDVSISHRFGNAHIIPYCQLEHWIHHRRQTRVLEQYQKHIDNQSEKNLPNAFLIIPFGQTSSWIDENWSAVIEPYEDVLMFYATDSCFKASADISVGMPQKSALRWYMIESNLSSTSTGIDSKPRGGSLPLEKFRTSHARLYNDSSLLLRKSQSKVSLKDIESNTFRSIRWLAWGARNEQPSPQLLGYAFSCESCLDEGINNKKDINKLAKELALILRDRLNTNMTERKLKALFKDNYSDRHELVHGQSFSTSEESDALKMLNIAHALTTEMLYASKSHENVKSYLAELDKKRRGSTLN